MLNTPLGVINSSLSVLLIFHEGGPVCRWANYRRGQVCNLFETFTLDCSLCGLQCV